MYIKFIVKKDGSISNIEVGRGVTPELDQEAIRVIAEMPKWIPGKVGEKPCRTRCRMPIVFTLEYNNTKPKKRRFWRK